MRKRIFLIGKIILTIVSLVGAIVFKINICNISIVYADILYDILVGIFSAMILVWFIDEISTHIQENQSHHKELRAIKRFDSVLQQYFEQYITMYYCVATPISDRKFDNIQMPKQFLLKDMRDLHQPSLLIKEGFTSGSLDSFLQIELDLRKEFVSLIEKYDFEYHPQFVDIFTKYIRASLKYDCRDVIKDNSNQIKLDQSYGELIHNLLENNADDYYYKIKQGENIGSNIAHPYIFIFEMMNIQYQCIVEYQNEIAKLTSEKISTNQKILFSLKKIFNKIKTGVSKLRKEKIKLFLAKHDKWIIPVITVLFIMALIFLFCKFNLLQKTEAWFRETLAVIGTLLGTIIGGVFTLMGSIYVNKKQLKAQTYIKRKNLIYKPLYDELCKIENDILSTTPYPSLIYFETSDIASKFSPQYTVWGRIKSDTRYLETPQFLIKEIDKLYERIGEYLKLRNNNNEMMSELANNILQDVIGTKCNIINFGDSIINCALKDGGEEVFKRYKDGLKEKVEVTDDQWAQADKKFYETCRKNEKILNIKSAKQEWDLQQKKVIEILTDLIQYVNIRYEG
ncbi:MAG: hypothetical protein IKJ47_00035 [Oscillospiraceae bacterium]|nr:hypothetical protein [Oscillospiraceae bacterium]